MCEFVYDFQRRVETVLAAGVGTAAQAVRDSLYATAAANVGASLIASPPRPIMESPSRAAYLCESLSASQRADRRPARRRQAYLARQKQAGVVGMTVRLDAETRAKLATLAERYGSKDAAMVAAIEALAAHPQG